MANMAAWSFNSNWLAHEIEHSHASAHVELAFEPSDHDGHGDTYPAGEDKAPGAVEHQLLHAADHPQLFPGIAFDHIPSPMPDIVLSHVISRTLPLAMQDPPFRPPRTISFLG